MFKLDFFPVLGVVVCDESINILPLLLISSRINLSLIGHDTNSHRIAVPLRAAADVISTTDGHSQGGSADRSRGRLNGRPDGRNGRTVGPAYRRADGLTDERKE